MVLLGWLLDILSLKSLSDMIFERWVSPSHPDYPVHRAIWSLTQKGRLSDAKRLGLSRWEASRSPRIGRDLIHILLKEKEYGRAAEVAEEMSAKDPTNPWLHILSADLCRFFIGDEDRSLSMYIDSIPACEAAMPDIYPQAVLYKRLTGIYRKRGDEEKLLESLEKFYSLAPTNFHDEEFILLAELKLKRGDRQGAKDVLETGFLAMKRCVPLREAYERMGFGEASVPPGSGRPDISGVTRLPIKTDLLTEADDPVQTVQKYVGNQAGDGDIVTLSSCVAAIMEGRMLMEGTVRPSFVARLLARLITGAHALGPFGASAPMANPLSVQTALEEVGTLRILFAALSGAIGKLFRIKGWFYVISGPQVAQIDDILGSIPPYDYYVMMGPKDPFVLSNRIASSLGAGVKAAVVDANDLGIAWAVGYSDGVDARSLERSMSDNPAGNQDQMTPVVIVRPEKEAAVESKSGSKSSKPRSGVSGRIILAIVLGVAIIFAAFGTAEFALAEERGAARPSVPVLLYHDITANRVSERGMSVPKHEFEEHIAILRDRGYTTITVRQILANRTGRAPLPHKPVLITFDDGYESFYTAAYPVLRRFGFKATAFVVGSSLGTPDHLTFDQIREMTSSGVVEIGSHTYAGHGGTSVQPEIWSWGEEKLLADFRAQAELFQKQGIQDVRAFAYPFGSPTGIEVEVAKKSGYKIGFTTDEGLARKNDPPMLQKRIIIWPGNDGRRFLKRVERVIALDRKAQ